MSLAFLFLLALLWGGALVPAVLKARQQTSPIASVRLFRQGMRALGTRRSGMGGRWIMMPPRPKPMTTSRRRSLERRRRILIGLLSSAGGTFVLGLIPGLRDLLAVHLMVDLALAAYVGLLLKLKRAGLPEAAPRIQAHERTEYQYVSVVHF